MSEEKTFLTVRASIRAVVTCVYCNAEFPPDVEGWLSGMIDEGCDSCGNGSSAEITVEIKCPNCGRIIYKKEGYKVY